MNRLADLLSRAGRNHAAKTAIIWGRREATFAEIEAESNRLAQVLSGDLGLAKGDRVGIILPNRPEFTIADWALIKAGLVRVPINPRLAPPEIAYIVEDSGMAALIYGGEFAEVIERIRSQATPVRHLVAVDDAPAGFLGWNEIVAAGDPEPSHVATEMEDPYMILYTSGTTGRPKGAMTTVRSRWVSTFTVYANEDFVHSTDVMLHVASLAHGSGTKVFTHYVKGATNVFLPEFSMASYCEAIERHRVTTTWLVPTLIGRLLDFPDRSQYDLSSLRTIVYAGAPMPAERLREAIETFGPVFVQVYGLSEAPQPATALAKEDHVVDGTPEQMGRLASAGRPCIGVDVRVVNETGDEVAAGEIGEVLIRGDHVMASYWNQPEATAEVLRDGWFSTGDLATIDAGGYLFIVDRKKDMIISGGYNVYPREVEEVLYRHPAVAECAVIGVPDREWGERVTAVVAFKPDRAASPKELTEHCRGLLASYKLPRAVELVDELPKSPAGKILKKKLREPHWRDRERQV